MAILSGRNMTLPEELIAMKLEIQPILRQSRDRHFISKLNIEDALLENPSPFIQALSQQRRRLLITRAMQKSGWVRYSESPRAVRTFMRARRR
jgi:hypothetical protein